MPTITVGGVTLTPIPATQAPASGSSSRIASQLYYAFDSSLGGLTGPLTVQVSYSTAPTIGSVVGCTSLFGVKQTAPEAASMVYNGSSSSPSASVTPITNGAWVIDATAAGFSSCCKTITSNGGTQLYNTTLTGGLLVAGSSYKSVVVAGSPVTLAWTVGGGATNASRFAESIAAFAPSTTPVINYSLTTTASPNGAGSVARDPDLTQYQAGTPVTLTAVPAAGYSFYAWTGDLAAFGSTNPIIVTMNSDKTGGATFNVAGATYTLTTSVSSGDSTGTISVSPAQATYAPGTSVTLTASPAAGYVFAGWSGALSGNTSPASLTMDGDKSVQASFVPAASGGTPDFGVYGFAQYAGVTGGTGGPTVTVDNKTDLTTHLTSIGKKTILVKGRIVGSNDPATDRIKIASDKTILGLNASGDVPQAELWGIELAVQPASTSDPNVSNVIIRNLKISHVLASNNDGDLIHIQNANKIWVDHCELFNEDPAVQTDVDLYDGMLDATDDSNSITVSWTYFHDHHKGSLVGHSSSDTIDRKMTYHHNYWRNVGSRMPSYRGGTGHVYNSYFANNLTSGVNIRQAAVMRVEGNVFENMPNPIGWFYDSSNTGFWDVRDNQFNSCTGSQPTTSTGSFTPPYSYTLEDSSVVKDEVMRWAGVGKIDPQTNQPVLVSTVTTLNASPATADAGATVNLTAHVSADTVIPTGTVRFVEGSTEIGTATLDGTGTATLATNALAVGSHSITATYLGNTGFAVSTSAVFTVTINALQPKPIANAQWLSTNANTAVSIVLSASNSPASWDYNQPAHGVLTGTAPDLTYTPTTGYAGSDSFTFTATNSGGTSDPASVTIDVLIAGGQVTLTPASLSFPDTTVGLGASSKIVTLTNSSPVGITITPTVSGPFAVWENYCTGTIASGASCKMFISYVPQVVGAETGTLSVTYTGGAAPLTVALSGTGIAKIQVSPGSLTFLATNIGSGTSAQRVGVLNRTGANITIVPTITGSFYISTNGCTGTLAPNSGCYIFVNYLASAPGQQTGQLTIAPSVGSAETVTLTGTGIGGDIQTTTTALTFAATNVGSATSSQWVGVVNRAGVNVTITPTLTGSFRISTNGCSGTLTPNSGCYIFVQYRPTAVGQQTGTLTITPSAGTVHEVSLTGTGQ